MDGFRITKSGKVQRVLPATRAEQPCATALASILRQRDEIAYAKARDLWDSFMLVQRPSWEAPRK